MNHLEEYISIIHQRQQNPLPVDAHGEKRKISESVKAAKAKRRVA